MDGIVELINGQKRCKTHGNAQVLKEERWISDGSKWKINLRIDSRPFKSLSVTAEKNRAWRKNERKQAQTRESSDLFCRCKVINKILDHNSFWQIAAQGIRVVWLCRTLPHTKSLITSPPADALPSALFLQDIWWKDKLRWWRYMFFFLLSFFFPAAVNLSVAERNFSRRNMKKKWEERFPHLHLETSCQSQARGGADEWGELEWGSLKSEMAN